MVPAYVVIIGFVWGAFFSLACRDLLNQIQRYKSRKCVMCGDKSTYEAKLYKDFFYFGACSIHAEVLGIAITKKNM